MSDLVAQARTVLRRHGGRMTAQRLAILQTLGELGGHPTAEQLCEAVRRRDRAIHPTTIYRTLGWLSEVGLVSQRHLDPMRHERCERFDASLPAEHHHFVCDGCGKVLEFRSTHIETAKSQLVERHGLQITSASLVVHGLCKACSDG